MGIARLRQTDKAYTIGRQEQKKELTAAGWMILYLSFGGNNRILR